MTLGNGLDAGSVDLGDECRLVDGKANDERGDGTDADPKDNRSPAIKSPPIMARTSVIADRKRVICNPDMRKSRLPQTVSQRKR